MKSLAEFTAAERVHAPKAWFAALYPLLLSVLVAFVLQAVLAPMLGPFMAKLLLDVGIAIILAVSLTVVNGFAGQFSLGHGGFMMVGGYAAAFATYYGSIALWGSPAVHGDFMGSGDLLFLAACLGGGLLAAVAGVVVGLPSLRLRGDYLAIVTLGFGEILRVLVQRTDDVYYPDEAKQHSMVEAMTHLGGSLGFSNVPTYVSPTPWLPQTGHAGVFFAYVFATVLLILAYRLKASSQGRMLLAVRENEIAAEAMGIGTSRAKVVAFVFSAFFAGIGGALYAHEATLNPAELGFLRSIDVVIIVVLGGMGSITGAVIAAVMLTLLPELFRDFAQYRMIVYALALIIVMVVRPQGLMGVHELWDAGWWRRLWRRGTGKGGVA